MVAIDLDAFANADIQKRYYGSNYYNSYNNGSSNWHRYRWLLFLVILLPILFLVFFWWGCKFLQRSNRRRQEAGTAPTETWDPNLQQAQGGNGGYYSANQQQQQQQGYGDGYNKEAGNGGGVDQYSSSQPTYGGDGVVANGANNANSNAGYYNENEPNVEYPNQTYQRPSGAPPSTGAHI